MQVTIDQLNKEIHCMKNTKYIPRSGDNVDNLLASFVNNQPKPDKLKIMFLRESEGVYQFGKRRVQIKAEKGGKLLVRVGGGFMHVKDFIEQFTVSE